MYHQKVAIDEAFELGKKYGNEESRDFFNGVLDRILKGILQENRQSMISRYSMLVAVFSSTLVIN
jgi:hypothetical protein